MVAFAGTPRPDQSAKSSFGHIFSQFSVAFFFFSGRKARFEANENHWGVLSLAASLSRFTTNEK
jgi:hypothetical protein